MILFIDNYDSFVYNLARYFELLGQVIKVVRNDELTIAEIEQLNPQAIVISPGPCTPNEAGISLEVVNKLGDHLPILGVCLGHQVIFQALGGEIVCSDQPVHGRTSLIQHNSKRLFESIENPLQVCRYHSLIANNQLLPDTLTIDAETEDGIVMAISHKTRPLFGVQFHPESILTQSGFSIINNFLLQASLSVSGDIEQLQSQLEVANKPFTGKYPTEIPSYY